MARKLRIQYPGAIYHIMNRGDRREPIFKDDEDRQLFLKSLEQTCGKTGWQVHAYCLMPNHFHFVLETPNANLVAGMKWLLGTYTGRFNRRHKLSGHLFGGRYKALVVDGSGGYLKTVCDYVHLNPVRARLISREEPLHRFRWSSYPWYLQRPARRPAWLRVGRLLGETGIPRDSAAGRRQFAAAMAERRAAESGGEYQALRRGWCLGGKEFRRELLAQMLERMGASHYGEERHETDEEKAQRLVRAELKRRGWREAELGLRRKGDAGKVAMARRLRAETTMTFQWMAARLAMGSGSNVANLLAAKQKAEQIKT